MLLSMRIGSRTGISGVGCSPPERQINKCLTDWCPAEGAMSIFQSDAATLRGTLSYVSANLSEFERVSSLSPNCPRNFEGDIFLL